jgi:hypothetical protein
MPNEEKFKASGYDSEKPQDLWTRFLGSGMLKFGA